MANSIFMAIMEQVQSDIQALSLTGLEAYEIQVRRLPHDAKGFWHRGITIYPLQENFFSGSNEREDVGYGLGIAMAQNNNNDDLRKLDQLLLWRETIVRHFVENSSMAAAATVFNVKVSHDHPIDWDRFLQNYDVSRLTLRAYSREART